MIVGLMADSHDHLFRIRDALDFFKKKKIELLLHAGDYVAPFAVRELKKLSCPFVGVFGNNDGEREGNAGNHITIVSPPKAWFQNNCGPERTFVSLGYYRTESTRLHRPST